MSILARYLKLYSSDVKDCELYTDINLFKKALINSLIFLVDHGRRLVQTYLTSNGQKDIADFCLQYASEKLDNN